MKTIIAILISANAIASDVLPSGVERLKSVERDSSMTKEQKFDYMNGRPPIGLKRERIEKLFMGKAYDCESKTTHDKFAACTLDVKTKAKVEKWHVEFKDQQLVEAHKE
jgi:hypothetical protein